MFTEQPQPTSSFWGLPLNITATTVNCNLIIVELCNGSTKHPVLENMDEIHLKATYHIPSVTEAMEGLCFTFKATEGSTGAPLVTSMKITFHVQGT